MPTQAYKQVMQIVYDGSYNKDDIIRYVAMNHPSIFLKACGAEVLGYEVRSILEICKVSIPVAKQLLETRNRYRYGTIDKVPAIEEVREIAGFGLKEAKDFIEGSFNGFSV
jgi:hypothetical protein